MTIHTANRKRALREQPFRWLQKAQSGRNRHRCVFTYKYGLRRMDTIIRYMCDMLASVGIGRSA